MRRIVAIVIPLAVIAVMAVVIVGGSSPTYRVDALFHTANGMVPGQNVDVAGTKVGTITAVRLLPGPGGGYRALIAMSISSRVAPFRADATCQILPESIIGEDYVDCKPGTSAARLSDGPTGAPTVAIDHTQAPLSLQAVLDTFAAPAPERLTLLLDELGIATSGRGADLNATLGAINPALTQVNRALRIVNDQRDELSTAVGQTDSILGELASRTGAVQAFVDRANSVLETTASRRTALAQGVHQLPRLLGALRSTLLPVKRAATAGVPLLKGLDSAAPTLGILTEVAPAFFELATPAARAVGASIGAARLAVAPTTKVAGELSGFSKLAQPFTTNLDRLLVSIRDNGGSEDLLAFLYAGASAAGAYDSVSHFPAAAVDVFPTCIIENMTPYTQDSPGCSHLYSQSNFGQTPASLTPSGSAAIMAPDKAGPTLRALLKYILQ